MAIAELVIDFAANLARFQTDLDKVKRQGEDLQKTLNNQFSSVQGAIDQVGSSIKSVTGLIGTMAGVLAGGAAFKSVISATTQWTGEVVSLSKTLGITTAQASGLNVALRYLGVESDGVKTATQRLAMSINKDGGSAIEAMGVKVRDNNGNLRNATDVMLDVNEKLSVMKAGLDRNTAAAAIYGKGWLGISDILKLTRAEFEAAQEKAARLHLVVGDEGAELVKKYKREMNDLKLVSTSLEVQIGEKLIPTMVKLGAAMSEGGQKGAGLLGKLLENVTEGAMKSGVYAGAIVDKTGAWLDSGGLIGQYIFGKRGTYEDRTRQISAAMHMQLSEIDDLFYGNLKSSSKAVSGAANTNIKSNEAAAESASKAAAEYRQFVEAMNAIQLKIENLNPYLTDEGKLFNEIVTWVAKEIELHPKHVSAIMAKAEAWQNAAEAAKAYKDRMSQISIGEQESQAGASAFGFTSFATTYDPLKVKKGMLKPGSGDNAEYEKMMRERMEIQQKYDAMILGSQMDLAANSLELIKRSVKEGSAVYMVAAIAQKALAVAQIIMNAHAASTAALLPPPIGLGPIAGQGLSAEILALGYTNAAMVGAMGIMDVVGGRAYGGSVAAGNAYVVGEQGPEIIRMGANGFVTPNHMLPTAGAGVTINQNMTITGVAADLTANMKTIAKQAKDEAVQAVYLSMQRGGPMAVASGRR